MNIAIIPLKIKSPGLALMYEAVCSSYHMGSPMWLEHQTVRWHGSVGSTYWYLRRKAHGRMAQLVEHIVHIDGVTGSSPVATTNPEKSL